MELLETYPMCLAMDLPYFIDECRLRNTGGEKTNRSYPRDRTLYRKTAVKRLQCRPGRNHPADKRRTDPAGIRRVCQDHPAALSRHLPCRRGGRDKMRPGICFDRQQIALHREFRQCRSLDAPLGKPYGIERDV